VGGRSVSMVPDPQEHARQRALMLPFFSPDVVAAKMPAIQETVRF
jgi:cytochrome P450